MKETKECTKCEIDKDIGKFRMREKNGYKYRNPTCRECDAQIARENHQKKKDIPEYRQKNAKRVREYNKANKDKIAAKKKVIRQQPEYKKYVSEYYRKNKDVILPQHREVCKKAIHEMRGWYIVGRLCGKQYGDLRQEIKQNPVLWEIKRTQIKIHRYDKEQDSSSKCSNAQYITTRNL